MMYATSHTWAYARIEEPKPIHHLNAKQWRRIPGQMIEREMHDRAINYVELFARLCHLDEDCGTVERLVQKVRRGRFSATLFVKIMIALNANALARCEE